MVLRFASQILLNLYFKCLILHWIEYIQRNKDFNGNHRNGPVFVRMSMLVDVLSVAVCLQQRDECFLWRCSFIFILNIIEKTVAADSKEMVLF